jgi:hypothetical protein
MPREIRFWSAPHANEPAPSLWELAFGFLDRTRRSENARLGCPEFLYTRRRYGMGAPCASTTFRHRLVRIDVLFEDRS